MDSIRKATSSMKADDAVEKVLDQFARTKSNREFVDVIKKIRLFNCPEEDRIMEEESKNPIQVAEKLFRVIELLAENGPMGIMELSASLGFHKSTVHRLVASLQYMGYIRQDEESLKYSLSLKFLEIGSRILEQTSMAALIHPSLKRLSEQTGETVHLVKREGTEAVYIDKVESFASSIRMVSRVGSRIPLYCSGVGKALLAELTDREIGEIWKNSRIPEADAQDHHRASRSHGTGGAGTERRICGGR